MTATTPTEYKLILTGTLDAVPQNFYDSMFSIIDDLGSENAFDSPQEYSNTKYLLSNMIYLIHERINLNMIREIDYDQVQSFAIQNKQLVRYLFKKKFPGSVEALDTWVEPAVDILELGLYRPSNIYNKHVFR